MRRYFNIRRIAVLALAALIILGTAASLTMPAAAAGPEDAGIGCFVNFATGAGLAEWRANAEASDGPVHGMKDSVEWKLDRAEYCTRFVAKHPVAKGEDGDARMTAELDFDPSEYRYIVFVYRMQGTLSKNHIYVKEEKGNTEYSAAEGTWLPASFKGNGRWQTVVLDLKKDFPAIKSRVKGIRIPVTCNDYGFFDIKYIAAFKDADGFEDFDFIAYVDSLPPEPTEAPFEMPTEAPAEAPTPDSSAADPGNVPENPTPERIPQPDVDFTESRISLMIMGAAALLLIDIVLLVVFLIIFRKVK